MLKRLWHTHFWWEGADPNHVSLEIEYALGRMRELNFSGFGWTPHVDDPGNPGNKAPLHVLANMLPKPGLGNVIQLGFEANIIPQERTPGCTKFLLDTDPADYPELSPYIASFHFVSAWYPKTRDSDTCLQQDPEVMTQGYLQMLDEHGSKKLVIGHPWGYASSLPSIEQYRRVAERVADCGAALEINGRALLKPRQDITLPWSLRPDYVKVLRETEASVAIGWDGHHDRELVFATNMHAVSEYLVRHYGIKPFQVLDWYEE